MKDINLSDKEQKLYDYIVTFGKTNVTVKSIEAALGKPYIGALGRLLNLGLIKFEKRNLELEVEGKNKYGYSFGHKWTKCYFIEEKK